MDNKVRLNIGGHELHLDVSPEGEVVIPEEINRQLQESLSAIESTRQLQKEMVSEVDADENPDGQTPAKDGGPKNDDNPAGKFRGLPMSELIGAPLFAAAEAQERLAGIAWDFYQKIAFTAGQDGKPTASPRLLEFSIERPVMQDGQPTTTIKQKVSAPFIGLVPIPSLLIDKVDVDFQMEVTDTNVSKSNTETETTASASAKWFGISASMSGKVSTSRENTRTSNQTAKYQVHVTASQQRPTEGLSKLMDIMASCIEPIDDKAGGGGGGS